MSGPQTGLKVNPEIVDMFVQGFKTTGVKQQKYDYITGQIIGNNSTEIVKGKCPLFNECEAESGLDKGSNVPCSFQSLKNYLISQKGGYGLYIFKWTQGDGERTKVTQISYCDDNTTPARLRMLYAGSKSTFSKAIGAECQLQFNDASDFDYKQIIMGISKGEAKM